MRNKRREKIRKISNHFNWLHKCAQQHIATKCGAFIGGGGGGGHLTRNLIIQEFLLHQIYVVNYLTKNNSE